MMETFDILIFGIQILIDFVVFIVLLKFGRFTLNRLKNSSHKFLNPSEYLPDEEIQTLKQVFYLIIMSLLFIDFVYTILYFKTDYFYLAILDVFLCLYLILGMDLTELKYKIIAFFMLPFGSLTFILFSFSYLSIFDIIHVPLLLYFIYLYYKKFKEYTENNGLGITILLLFTIIFVSFFFTMFVEYKNPLDSLVMVSNAFTSNGYAVLGKSVIGKIDSIVLVWGGYIISGVVTASLTAAILLEYFNHRIKRLEKLIDEKEDE